MASTPGEQARGLEAMDERESIGQTLRHRREERGLTIEQAAFQSKVPLRLFQALEADDYHLLPDALYLIRLLHDLAVFLKLDPGALETEFRSAIRRPPRQTLAVGPPPPPPPTLPWKQVAWTAAAIVVITPLVFIALSLTSKRAAETPTPPPVEEPVTAESPPVEGSGGVVADRLLAMRSQAERSESSPNASLTPEPTESVPPREGSAPASAPAPRPAEPARGTSERAGQAQTGRTPAAPASSTAPPAEQIPRRFVLTARAVQLVWMSVRADGGERRQVTLQPGQVARFVADTGFVVTLGNAGGVDLTLNGTPVPSAGKSGQVVRDMAIPVAEKVPGSPGAARPRESPQTVE